MSYPDIEVRAGAMNVFLAAFDVFPSLAEKYLVEAGVARRVAGNQLQPTRGYIPLDTWLGTFDSVLVDIGPNALFKIGQRITGNPYFPGTVTDLESALKAMDVAFHLSHRRQGKPMFDDAKGTMSEGIGHYLVRRNGKEKQIQIECDTPYPCPLEHGIVSGIAWHFDSRAIVVHDAADPCRSKGAKSCTYAVRW